MLTVRRRNLSPRHPRWSAAPLLDRCPGLPAPGMGVAQGVRAREPGPFQRAHPHPGFHDRRTARDGDGGKTNSTRSSPSGFDLDALQEARPLQTVTLGHNQFYRYLNLTHLEGRRTPRRPTRCPRRSARWSPSASPRERAARRSWPIAKRIIGTLQLSSASVLGLGPSSSYASGLKAAMAKLNAQQSSAGARLSSAKKPSDQASTANELATAFRQAGASVQKLQSGPAAASTNAAIATALQNVGAGYTGMAQAAAHNNGSGYNAARRRVASATADLRAAFNRLSQLGYTAA